VHRAQQSKCTGQRNCMSKKRRTRTNIAMPHLLESRGESGFTERADSQAGQRDAHLYAGNNAMQIGEQAFDDASADITFRDELANAGKAHGNEGKLRGGEKAVKRNERQHTDQPHGKHSFLVVP
jgi:hypothetical protein